MLEKLSPSTTNLIIAFLFARSYNYHFDYNYLYHILMGVIGQLWNVPQHVTVSLIYAILFDSWNLNLLWNHVIRESWSVSYLYNVSEWIIQRSLSLLVHVNCQWSSKNRSLVHGVSGSYSTPHTLWFRSYWYNIFWSKAEVFLHEISFAEEIIKSGEFRRGRQSGVAKFFFRRHLHFFLIIADLEVVETKLFF